MPRATLRAFDSLDSAGPNARELQRSSPPCLHSDALLQGQSSVSIQHNGAVYRLQATKLGKLILTK